MISWVAMNVVGYYPSTRSCGNTDGFFPSQFCYIYCNIYSTITNTYNHNFLFHELITDCIFIVYTMQDLATESFLTIKMRNVWFGMMPSCYGNKLDKCFLVTALMHSCIVNFHRFYFPSFRELFN